MVIRWILLVRVSTWLQRTNFFCQKSLAVMVKAHLKLGYSEHRLTQAVSLYLVTVRRDQLFSSLIATGRIIFCGRGLVQSCICTGSHAEQSLVTRTRFLCTKIITSIIKSSVATSTRGRQEVYLAFCSLYPVRTGCSRIVVNTLRARTQAQ